MHIGNLALAPKLGATVTTSPPIRTGGNVDNRRIGIGATMFYPVEESHAATTCCPAPLPAAQGLLLRALTSGRLPLPPRPATDHRHHARGLLPPLTKEHGCVVLRPPQVEGGLITMGDCHGSQGDGETSCTGIETSLNGRFK